MTSDGTKGSFLMKKRLRSLYASLVFTVLCSFFAPKSPLLAEQVGNADQFQIALEGTTDSIEWTGPITIRRADPDDSSLYLDFVVGPIERSIKITSGGHAIRYGDVSAETDNVEFYLEVGANGELHFADEIQWSGGHGFGNGLFSVTENGKLTFDEKATLSKNLCWYQGGAIFAETGAEGRVPSLTFKSDAIFIENVAYGSGGAVALVGDESRVTLTVAGDAELTSNRSEQDGGALYAETASLTFQKLKVQGNEASNFGGAFALDDSILTVRGAADFIGNKTEFAGGAISQNEGSTVFEDNANFQDNRVSFGDGGAIYLTYGSANFKKDAVFQNNRAIDGFGGGAIYADGLESRLIFEGTTRFESNRAESGSEGGLPAGGAVYVKNLGDITENAIVYGWEARKMMQFSGNQAGAEGGAIYAYFSAMKFSDATFSGNISLFEDSVADGIYGGGGAIYSEYSSIVFGGPVSMVGNKAEKGSGGAVFVRSNGVDGSNDLEIPIYDIRFDGGVTIEQNVAARGGAVFLDGAAISFGGTSSIVGNSATANGGAFYVYDDSAAVFLGGSSTTIAENAAARGGAIYIDKLVGLTLKLESGTADRLTTLQIDVGKENARNDVFLDQGSLLTLDTAEYSRIVFGSKITGSDDSEIVKRGVGSVFVDGDLSDFTGSLTIEGGEFHINSTGSFGSTASTILTVGENGLLVLTVGESDLATIQAKEVELHGETDQIHVKTRSDSSDERGFALISLHDDGEKDETWWTENILEGDKIVGEYDFLEFDYDVLQDTTKGISTLYVKTKLKSEGNSWNVVLREASDVFKLNEKLDDASKTLDLKGKGLLQLNNDDRIAGLSGDGNLEILDQKTLTLAGTSDSTFTGNIAGKGGIVKDGSGTQTFLGDNTYTGGTIVLSGTLAGNTQSLQHEIRVEEGATVLFDQLTLENPSGSFAGTLSGKGRFVVKGNVVSKGIETDGGLRLTGDNSGFEGETVIESGWLILDSLQESGGGGTAKLSGDVITVKTQSGLGGSGEILADVLVQSGGALQAYGGKLHVKGSLEFKQGGVLYVQVDGKNTHVVEVAGNVNLDGASVKIVGVGSNYVKDETFTFLQADSIQGRFAEEKIEYSDGKTDWTFRLAKSEDEKKYNMTGTDKDNPNPPDPPDPPEPPTPTSYPLSRNQDAVAVALDLIGPGTTGFGSMIADLDTHRTLDEDGNVQFDETYRDAVKQLGGSVRLNGMQLGLFSPYRTVFNRLTLGNELYDGGQKIYNNGYGPISGMERHGAGAAEETMLGQFAHSHCGGLMEPSIPCMMGENNFWFDAVHLQAKIRSDGNSDAYGMSRTGFLLGFDIQKQMSSRIGAVFGYFAPYLWQNSDRVEADDYHAGLYFQKKYLGTDLYGYFGYAHQDYDSTRYVDLSGLGSSYGRERYTGKTKGDSFSFSLELSRPRYYGCEYVLKPLIAVDYFHTTQKGYTETGSGSGLYALQYDKAKYDQWFVRLGVNLRKDACNYTGVLRIQYINQFGENPYPDGNARFALVDGSPMMNVRGVDLRRDYLNCGFGVNLFVNGSRSKVLSFDYDVNMTRRMTAHLLSLVYIERF